MPVDKGKEKMVPFDVLGHIFSYYAAEENIEYPLETLLLVCKSWSQAALGHRTLWKHLKVYIGHEPAPTIWTARLPLRLARCGPNMALDVDLRNLLDVYSDEECKGVDRWYPDFELSCEERIAGSGGSPDNCSCHIAASECARLSLQTLTGSNGEICARWRSLTLYLGPYQCDDVGLALIHATPILEHIELGRVQFDEEDPDIHLFPDVYSLKRLSLFECELPSLPRCDGLLEVSLRWEVPHEAYSNLSLLRSAGNLQLLSIQDSFDCEICLPSELPHLRVLKIERDVQIDHTDLLNCRMPQLLHLSLSYLNYNLLRYILLGDGIPIEKLSRVTLRWKLGRVQSEDSSAEVMDSLRAFLTRARDLKHLDSDKRFLSLVIKVLWNSRNDQANSNLGRSAGSAGPTFKNVCLTYTTYDLSESTQFEGQETTLFIEELANKWGCIPPNLPNDVFNRQVADTW